MNHLVSIWDSSLTHVLQTIDVGPDLNTVRGPLAVSPDGRSFAVAAGDVISIWSLK